jgi:hypothetical protein
MRKVSKEEIEWIRDNKEEFIKSLSDSLIESDYLIYINKDEFDSLPTSDDRRKSVNDTLKKLNDREVNEPLSEEIKQKSIEYQQELRKHLKTDNMIEVDKRLSKKEILKMYGIDRTTFELWVKERGLPVIEVSTHSKYVRESDLIDWEEGLILKRIFREIGVK